VFHGIRDAQEELDGPTFFALAIRLSAYQGVLAARLANEIAEEERQNPSQPAAVPRPSPGAPGPGGDTVARFRAQASAPIATAAELASMSASAGSLPALGDVVQVKAPER
jgi:hypothetical protein